MNKNANAGFTLIELLVATVIIGVLSIVSTRLLFDAVTIESKQSTIDTSSDSGYFILEQIARNIRYAKNVNITSNSEIKLTYPSDCINYRFNATNNIIEKATDSNPPCNPSGYTAILPDEFFISNLNFSPIGMSPENVSIKVEGEVRDSLGIHPVIYETNIVPRISL